MTRNRHIVIVNQQLNVQVLCNSESGSFGVVAFLLGAVGAEEEDVGAGVGHRYTAVIQSRISTYIQLGKREGVWEKGRNVRRTYLTRGHMCPSRPEENLTPGVRPSSG